MLNKAKPSEELDNFFENEAKRRFYSLNPVKVVDFTSGNYIEAGILSKISGKKYNVRHGDFFLKSKLSRYLEKFTKKLEKNYGFSEIDNFEKENELYIEHSAENVYANEEFQAEMSAAGFLMLEDTSAETVTATADKMVTDCQKFSESIK